MHLLRRVLSEATAASRAAPRRRRREVRGPRARMFLALDLPIRRARRSSSGATRSSRHGAMYVWCAPTRCT